MKLLPLSTALGCYLLASCGPGLVNPKTQAYVQKQSDVPANLPLPTLEFDFYGNHFSDPAGVVERYTSSLGQKFVVYGVTKTIGSAAGNAELSLFYSGRTNGDDQWVIDWNFNGSTGKQTITYQPGQAQQIVDVENFKVSVK